MRLISWNVNRAVRRIEKQILALMGRDADVIALQEVSIKAVSRYWEMMRGKYPYFIDSLRLVTKNRMSTGRKPNGVVIASSWPLEIMKTSYAVATAEHKLLSVIAKVGAKKIEIHTAHVPPGVQNGPRKVRTLQGIYDALKISSENPRILCGDFNTPQEEKTDGIVVTWAQRKMKNGELQIDKNRGEKWDEAERNILTGLSKHDLTDVFRSLHPYSVSEHSWFWKGKVKGKEKVIGRRYDHIFASQSLKPKRCEYLHDFRYPKRLSDHSPIELDLTGI